MSRFDEAFDRDTPPPRRNWHLQPVTDGADPYGQAALAREAENVATAVNGTRNDTLNRAAYSLSQLVAAGRLTDTEVHDTLANAARAAGLDPHEIEATLKSGHRAGIQQPRDIPDLDIGGTVSEVAISDLIQHPADQEADSRARTSWWPSSLVGRAANAAEEPAPTHLIRDDGQALFYSGKVNGLIGESESGKSWIALLAVVQALGAGQPVLMLDFEDSPASIHRRMTSLGLTDPQLEPFDYADPDEALGAVQTEDLAEALAGHQYRIIVVDGVNAAMTLLGLDLNSNTDATRFTAKVLRPLAQTGACVITVDHVPKRTEERGKGGIGAQAKRAMMDGCALTVEIVEPFGKGQSGVLKLIVDKDRNGHVRGASAGGKNPGRAHIDSIDDQVRIHITAPDLHDSEKPGWRPTEKMEAISRCLEQISDALTFNQIDQLVPGKRDTIKDAVAALVDAGHITIEPGRNRSLMHRLTRPFRESDNASSSVIPGGSQVVPESAEPGGSRVPSPYGEGTTHGTHSEPPSDSSDQETLNLPDDQSSCNTCGQPTDDAELDRHDGHCRACSARTGGR